MNPQKRQEGAIDPLISIEGGVEYLTTITFGETDVDVIVDTGSSDTWLIQSGFKCVNANNAPQSEGACNFGPPYPGNFGYAEIPGVNFNISYGDGEFVTGNFGNIDITVAGITVPGQTAALGNYAYWNGDGVSSGLMGLAYSGLTSEYKGTDPHKDKSSNRNLYDPIFTSMYKDDLVDSVFSMAIERSEQGTDGGYIAFGGLPPVKYTGNFATTPIQVTNQPGFVGSGTFLFYAMTPQAFQYNGYTVAQSQAYIVDSGTTLIYAASDVAAGVAKMFNPPAKSQGGLYTVRCNAKAPGFGVKIGGTVFQVSAEDLIVDNGDGTCISGVQDGGSGPFILGDVFMKNVVVVFDVGAAELRFAAHVKY